MAKDEASETESEKTSSRRWIEELIRRFKMTNCGTLQKTEWISHAQISNTFILLMALNQAKKASTAGEISEIIVQKSRAAYTSFPLH
jgi:hypothetical protein